MEVYVALYDTGDRKESGCLGVFFTKEAAETRIRTELEDCWDPDDFTYSKYDDTWISNYDRECIFYIEKYNVA